MLKFFDYFARRFDWKEGFVSAHNATRLQLYPSGMRATQRERGTCLFVQDWLDHNNNAARALDESGKKRVMKVSVVPDLNHS